MCCSLRFHLLSDRLPLVVFAEGHDDAGTELPRFPVITEADDVHVLSPGYFFTPQVALGPDVLALEHESPVVSQGQLCVPAPAVASQVIPSAAHTFHPELQIAAEHQPVRDNLNLRGD